MKVASGWRIYRTWDFSLRHFLFSLLCWIRNRYSSKQCLCIGMLRMRKDFISCSHFNDAAEIHNCNTITEIFGGCQVMRDEQVG